MLSLLMALVPNAAFARTLLVLGDSLSAGFGIDINAGWVALLQQRLMQEQRDYNVVNASISGDTTANGLARLPPLLAKHRPHLVIVELGGNDGLRGLPLEQMKHNIDAIVAKAKASGANVLLLGVRLPPNYGPAYTEKFQQIYREVANERRVPLVPFMLNGVDTNPSLMQPDGLHPRAQAQTRILDNVWARLKTLL